MPIVDPLQKFTLTRGDGLEVFQGQFKDAMKHVPQSIAALDAETAIRLAAETSERERDLEARADTLQAREDAVTARERALAVDAVLKFSDGVAALERRLDAYEARQEQQRIADEIAAADRALEMLQSDHGDLEIKPAPAIKEKEREELAAETNADEEGGSPSLPEPPRRIHVPAMDLPPALAHADGYVCGRDRRAARKLARKESSSNRLYLRR
jgi:hypothetical protein